MYAKLLDDFLSGKETEFDAKGIECARAGELLINCYRYLDEKYTSYRTFKLFTNSFGQIIIEHTATGTFLYIMFATKGNQCYYRVVSTTDETPYMKRDDKRLEIDFPFDRADNKYKNKGLEFSLENIDQIVYEALTNRIKI